MQPQYQRIYTNTAGFKEEPSLLHGRIYPKNFWSSIVFFPIWILTRALTVAGSQSNPIQQGIQFIVFILLIVGFFDMALFGGIFIFKPFISILIEGNLEDTFWACEDFVVVEEGSYCAYDS